MLQTPLHHALLYMPADQDRMLSKAQTLAADGVIFDLEDAVAPEKKETARENLRIHFAEYPNSEKQRIIRINGRGTKWFTEDLLAARKCLPDAILVPKLETAEQAREIQQMLEETDAPATLKLWGMVETAKAIINIAQLADHATSRLAALVLGANDLTLETGMEAGPSRNNHMPWMVQTLLAAKAGGTLILDSVYNHFSDLEGLSAEAEHSAELGFDGKTAIHPKQIQPIQQAFAPSSQKIETAQTIVAAFEKPNNSGKGAIQLNGKMVERLHLTEAKKLLNKAHMIQQRDLK